MLKIALVPLDERPVNTRYPAMLADIAGVELIMPPQDYLSNYRIPASVDNLTEWLHEIASELDVLIVSVEMLGSGSLITSRLSNESPSEILIRLDSLRQLKQTFPELKILGFNVITRIPNYNDAIEEPSYWADYGAKIYQLSASLHRRSLGESVDAEIVALEQDIPLLVRNDWLVRRLRNHTINLATMHLAATGVFDLLVLSSDDTAPYGLGTQEKSWLAHWAKLTVADDSRLLMYPGADEVGCVLLARAILNGRSPKFWLNYIIPDDKDRVAPYEDVPVSVTLERQIRAIGGKIVAKVDAADFVVIINPPSPLNREFDPEHADEERHYRKSWIVKCLDEMELNLSSGHAVILVDVAYPNGSDPVLIECLNGRIDLNRLAAYGAWNTAGNTIGTALAHGVVSRIAETSAQHVAQERFLVHRFIEDWGYQHIVRKEVRHWLEIETGKRDVTPETMGMTRYLIESRLNDLLLSLQSFGDRWFLVENSVHLPWNRTFEVDFDLEKIS